jgi:ubiquinone/menaquinone biosynthesis C-methylase UbiE
MLEPDVMNYLREIARVLKPGGGIYATFFLLNREANDLIAAGRSSHPMRYSNGHSKVFDSSMPELAVGLDESTILPAMRSFGLTRQDVRYGSWCGRNQYFDYQDVIYAVRS